MVLVPRARPATWQKSRCTVGTLSLYLFMSVELSISIALSLSPKDGVSNVPKPGMTSAGGGWRHSLRQRRLVTSPAYGSVNFRFAEINGSNCASQKWFYAIQTCYQKTIYEFISCIYMNSEKKNIQTFYWAVYVSFEINLSLRNQIYFPYTFFFKYFVTTIFLFKLSFTNRVLSSDFC